MSTYDNKAYPLWKQLTIGGVGAIIDAFLTGAAGRGMEFVFSEEDVQFWGWMLWGDHWFLRLIVSVSSSILSGFVVGVALPNSNKWAATVSALPSVLLFLGGGVFLLSGPENIAPVTAGWWFTIVIITFISIPVTRYAALFGASWRQANDHLYGKPNRPLGIHWSNLLWMWIPYYIIYADLWLSFVYLMHLGFFDNWQFLLAFGRVLIGIAFLCQGYGMLQGLWFLTAGQYLGLRPVQVAGKVILNIVVIPSIAVALRAGGFMILNVHD